MWQQAKECGCTGKVARKVDSDLSVAVGADSQSVNLPYHAIDRLTAGYFSALFGVPGCLRPVL